jgi:hypothetical protein
MDQGKEHVRCLTEIKHSMQEVDHRMTSPTKKVFGQSLSLEHAHAKEGSGGGKNNVMMNVNVIIAMLSFLAETAMIVLRLFVLGKSASLLAALFCC